MAGRYSVPATFDVSWTADSCIGDRATIELCRVDANGDVTGDCVEIEVDVPDDGSFEDALLAAMPPAGAGPYVVKVSDSNNPDVFAYSEVIELCDLAVAEPVSNTYSVPATFDVSWTADSCIGDTATIELCRVDANGDVTGDCVEIEVDVPDDGSFEDALLAAMPPAGAGPYVVKVSDPDNPDVFAFSEVVELCDLAVAEPKAGSYTVPATFDVVWDKDSCIGDRATIEICPVDEAGDVSGACEVVAVDVPDGGSLQDAIQAALPASGEGPYRIKVSDPANPDVFAYSEIIELCELKVTSPSGDGLAYDVPVAVPVTWEADACVGDRIQISLCPAGAPRDPACVVVDFDGDDATDNDGSEDVLLAVLPPAGAGSYQFVISDQANPDVFGLSPVFSLGDVCVKCLQNRDCAGSSVCVAPASRRRLMFGHFSAEGCCSVG